MPETYSEADLDRLNAFVAKGDAGAAGCWKWTGPNSSNSGPVLTIRGARRQVRRVVYELRCGPVPAAGNWYVLPTCRNRACVNPSHLTLSTSPTLPTAPPTHAPPALAAPVLAALDAVTALDAAAVGRELAACEARLVTLKALLHLATAARGPVSPVALVSSPAPVPAPAPQPNGSKVAPAKKRARPQPSRTKLARRMAFFLASAGPTSVADLATAMGATVNGVEFQTKSTWFTRTGDLIDVTDAGKAVALEGQP